MELPFDFVSDENHGGAGGTCVIRGCVPKKLLVYAYVRIECSKQGEGVEKCVGGLLCLGSAGEVRFSWLKAVYFHKQTTSFTPLLPSKNHLYQIMKTPPSSLITMMSRSEFSDAFKQAEGFGWGESRPPHELARLIAKKNDEIRRLNGVYSKLLGGAGVEFLEGRGVVLDAHTVEVRAADGSVRRLRTRNILVATGGHAVKIPIPGAEHAITSDEALVLEELPGSSVVVIGGGYIAVEFAGIFRGLGANVHLMHRAPLPLRKFDDECRSQVLENLRGRGVDVLAGCQPLRVEREGEGAFVVRYSDPSGAERSVRCGVVMMATGRRPRTRGIGLEDAGVEMDTKSGAVKVDAYSRTSVPSIWAIGDATERMELTPVAIMEGKALVETLFGPEPVKPDYEYIASAVFCQPPLGTVGMTEEEAVAKLAGELDVYVSKFRPMRNTLSGSPEKTLMKMLVHVASDKVVGCHMVGPDAGEIMQGLAVALKCGATKRQFDATVGIHPTAAEEWVTMSSATR